MTHSPYGMTGDSDEWERPLLDPDAVREALKATHATGHASSSRVDYSRWADDFVRAYTKARKRGFRTAVRVPRA